ncbi:MAG: alkaline phosphatase, partial [Candidatus Binatia bacterium]
MKISLRLFAALVGALILFSITYSVFPPQRVNSQQNPAGRAPKFIFLFLADGAGTAHMEITRRYRQEILREPMVITDKIMKEGSVGLVTTHAANSLSTDSAAAATALASGCKAEIGALGVCANGSVPTTVMEIAKQRGLKIALVTNSTVYDASPAAFVCHVPNRRDYAAILNRYLDLEPDILMGGGRAYFLPRDKPGSRRKDETNVAELFARKGYQEVSDKRELERAGPGKILGLFSLNEMSFEIERDKNSEPSVYDMTRSVIRQLHDSNSKGFFAFIENENTDTASHLSDLPSVIHDYREFDRAVGLAYEFYKKYPHETLVLVTSDHETGGLGFTMALKDLSSTLGSNQVAGTIQDLRKLRAINISLRRASRLLGSNPTAENIDKLVREHFSGFTLPPEYKEAILKGKPVSRTIYLDPTANALGMMIANHTQAYWQTTSHTNQPVFVAALGAGAERFAGYYDNADFGKKLMGLLNG